MALDILTFGCRLNTYESEVMRTLAVKGGLDDTVIVNTCAVTSEAERQARQAIRRARRERPDARIIVTGCAAQIAPERYAAMPEVDRVLGNAEKLTLAGLTGEAPILVDDAASMRETAQHLIDGLDGRTRAIVQVQQGCDHRCTFCVIPLGRGPSRSVPLGPIVEQVRRLTANGVAEVVLSGVDVTAYGADLPGRPSLGGMLKRLLAQVPELKRLRLSSLDPVEVDPALIDLIASEPRLMPHLHLSLQAGDDLVLKRMKRRHSRDEAIGFCLEARGSRPDLAFGADLIAGFPTETEAMFDQTLALVEDCDLSYLHVFRYSPRPGTPAARMPQTPARVIAARAARLRQAGAAALARHLERRVGGSAQVLVERPGFGRAEDFTPVMLAEAPVGAVVEARLVGRTESALLGEVTAAVPHPPAHPPIGPEPRLAP